MSPHTDAGALLKRTPEQSFDGLILEADWADMHGGGHHDDNCEVCRDIANVRAAIRQAASQGNREVSDERALALAHSISVGKVSAIQGACDIMEYATVAIEQEQRFAASHGREGGEPSEVRTTPVSYRWRQPGNKHWIYDPTPEWIEDYKHEIELEALYLGAAQGCAKCGGVNCRDCGKPIDVAYILQHPRSCIVCDPEFGDPRDSRRPAQAQQLPIGPRELKPITMSEIRLAAGEGKLSAHDVLAAANAVLRMRQRALAPSSASRWTEA